jgi:hypothetical protein
LTSVPSSTFGLALDPRFPLPGLPPRVISAEQPRIELRPVSQEQLNSIWSGPAGEVVWETLLGPGAHYALRPGAAGDHLISYPKNPSFHLSADGATLSCADPSERNPDWTRTLLDTVLWSVALLRGMALLHAGAVLSPRGVVAIVGAQGAGKSSLVGQLLEDGWPLFTDDILAYQNDGERVTAYPGPALMNLSTRPGAIPEPDAIGRVLAHFDDEPGAPEAWVELAQDSLEPMPLRALVLLARAGESRDIHVSAMSDPLTRIIPHTLAFRTLPGALRARFEAASDLVARVPVFCVNAGIMVPPAELAVALRFALDSTIDPPSSDN